LSLTNFEVNMCDKNCKNTLKFVKVILENYRFSGHGVDTGKINGDVFLNL